MDKTESKFKPGMTVGIDLGTTRSSIAYVDEYGKASVIPSGSELVTPSVVLIDEGDVILVGSDAKNQSVAAGSRVIRESKRDIGRTDAKWEVDGTTYTPEMIGSIILKKLKNDAATKLHEPPVNAVITVPAYFDDSQRAATEAAGELAELNVVAIMNEPVAAALAYGLDRRQETGHIVVYDLGGGTFDVSVMKVESGKITMIATDGNVELGGKDWDERIIKRVSEKFVEEHRVDPLADVDTYQQLKNDAESAKESLSTKEKTRIIAQYEGYKLVYELTRDEFEEMTADLLSQTENTLVDVVEDQAGLTWDQVHRILLVGGSSKMPQVARMIKDVTGKDVSVGDPEPDLCVALGAAYYGLILEAQEGTDEAKKKISSLPPEQQKAITETEITMVTSHSYGVEILNENDQPENAIMIKKNSALPATHRETFGLRYDNQDSVAVNVWEGESKDLKFCKDAGKSTLAGFPPSPMGTPVEVTMTFTKDGVIKVHAETRGKTLDVEFDRPQGMSVAERKEARNVLSKKKVE